MRCAVRWESLVRKDIIDPLININYPEDKTYWDNPLPLNVSCIDSNFNSVWYRVYISSYYGWSENVTLTNDLEQNLNSSIWDKLYQGSFIVEIFMNDSVGNFNSTILVLHKDTVAPWIEIHSPEGWIYYNTIPLINVSIYDQLPDSIWYRIYSEEKFGRNITLINNKGKYLDVEIWNNLPQGGFVVYYYANDSFGHLDYFTQMLYKDTEAPIIEIESPLNFTYYNNHILNYSYITQLYHGNIKFIKLHFIRYRDCRRQHYFLGGIGNLFKGYSSRN